MSVEPLSKGVELLGTELMEAQDKISRANKLFALRRMANLEKVIRQDFKLSI